MTYGRAIERSDRGGPNEHAAVSHGLTSSPHGERRSLGAAGSIGHGRDRPSLEQRKRERLLVVGAGMAGLKLVEELVELCPGRYDIAMVGAEARPAYNRVLLSSLLAGDAAEGRHRAAAGRAGTPTTALSC